jgi:hypothetical protein
MFIRKPSFMAKSLTLKSGYSGHITNTHFVYNNFFFFENRTVYEITWKNVERGGPQMAIWRMRVAYWVPKATNTHTEAV